MNLPACRFSPGGGGGGEGGSSKKYVGYGMCHSFRVLVYFIACDTFLGQVCSLE